MTVYRTTRLALATVSSCVLLAACSTTPQLKDDPKAKAFVDDGMDYYAMDTDSDLTLKKLENQWEVDENGDRIYLVKNTADAALPGPGQYYVGDIRQVSPNSCEGERPVGYDRYGNPIYYKKGVQPRYVVNPEKQGRLCFSQRQQPMGTSSMRLKLPPPSKDANSGSSGTPPPPPQPASPPSGRASDLDVDRSRGREIRQRQRDRSQRSNESDRDERD